MRLDTTLLPATIEINSGLVVESSLGNRPVTISLNEIGEDNSLLLLVGRGPACIGLRILADGAVEFYSLGVSGESQLQRHLNDGTEVYAKERPMPKVNGREAVRVETGLWKVLNEDDEPK